MTRDLDNAAQVYGQLVMQKKAIEQQLKELEPHLKEAFADKGSVVRGDYVFKATTQAGRKTLDKKALAEACKNVGIDIEAFYKVGAPFVRMSVDEVA